MDRLQMRMVGLLMAVLLCGCGDGEKREGWSRALPELTATETEWNGWQALRMENGLVTVVTVPAIGGRTMAYDLGTQPLLWINPQEMGRVYPAPEPGQERVWRNYGGYKTWPAPQEKWGGPGDPEGSFLDGGPYLGEILQAKGKQVQVRVTSKAEQDTTGLRFQRTLTLFHGSTRLQVEQTMVNISAAPVEWSIWDVTQVPGLLGEETDATPRARVYFPLNPAGRFEGGFFAFSEEFAASPQWQPDPERGLMVVEYRGETGKIGADSTAGWIAYVDELHEAVYVKRFEVRPEETYPDRGATVEVYTNGGDPYLEVEVLSPLRTLQPGESYTFTQDWYATRCPGPVLEANEWGVVSQPLQAEARDAAVTVRGVLGVFAEGWARLVCRDAQGRELKRSGRLLVTPATPFRLDEGLDRPTGATRVEVLLEDGDGQELGVLTSAEITEAPAMPVVSEEEQTAEAAAPGEGGPQESATEGQETATEREAAPETPDVEPPAAPAGENQDSTAPPPAREAEGEAQQAQRRKDARSA